MYVYGSVCTMCVCVCVCAWVCEFFLHWRHSAVSALHLSMHLFWIVSDFVWALNVSVVLLPLEGQKSLGFYKKYLKGVVNWLFLKA